MIAIYRHQKLEDFLTGETPVVYISFGTAFQSIHLPAAWKNIIVDAASSLPYKILWKFDGELLDLPENVMIMKWLPQQDILGESFNFRTNKYMLLSSSSYWSTHLKLLLLLVYTLEAFTLTGLHTWSFYSYWSTHLQLLLLLDYTLEAFTLTGQHTWSFKSYWRTHRI